MDLFSLKNKVIIVTGASGLLGREHAEAIASHEGIPVLIDLNEEMLNEQLFQLKSKYGVDSVGYAVDITDEIQVKKNSEVIFKKFGRIDGLVNNAANNPKVENTSELNFSRLENFPIKNWEKDIDVTLKGSFLCIKYYGYIISKNSSGGSIVNISSDLGLIAPDQRLYAKDGIPEELQAVKPITYSVVKTGLIGMTRYVSTYWSDKNVRCNAICPGGVQNNQHIDFINKIKKRIPLNRMADKSEYRGLLVFLLSDSSSYITGSIIAADGGRSTW